MPNFIALKFSCVLFVSLANRLPHAGIFVLRAREAKLLIVWYIYVHRRAVECAHQMRLLRISVHTIFDARLAKEYRVFAIICRPKIILGSPDLSELACHVRVSVLWFLFAACMQVRA